MLHIDWSKTSNYEDEDITYFLFLEGKSVESLCKIRNLSMDLVKQHILNGKIKYGILAKSKDEKDLFKVIQKAGKQDKIQAIQALDSLNKENLIKYIRENYGDMKTKDKENAVWILGELKSLKTKDILIKACVHNHVNVRRMAASAIGKIGDSSLDTVLLRCLEDENPQVVMYAIKSFIKIGSKKGSNKIKNIYENSQKDYLKRAAEEYLKLSNEDSKFSS